MSKAKIRRKSNFYYGRSARFLGETAGKQDLNQEMYDLSS